MAVAFATTAWPPSARTSRAFCAAGMTTSMTPMTTSRGRSATAPATTAPINARKPRKPKPVDFAWAFFARGVIVLAGGGDPECHGGGQLVLAAFVLMLALCDWHVPLTVPLHYKVCRLLSALCMHCLYPTSATMICLAFADPTFGKRAKTSAAPASGQTDPGASEHTSGTSEHDMAIGASEHTMSGTISLDDAIENCKFTRKLTSSLARSSLQLLHCAIVKVGIAWQLSTRWRQLGRWIDE